MLLCIKNWGTAQNRPESVWLALMGGGGGGVGEQLFQLCFHWLKDMFTARVFHATISNRDAAYHMTASLVPELFIGLR